RPARRAAPRRRVPRLRDLLRPVLLMEIAPPTLEHGPPGQFGFQPRTEATWRTAASIAAMLVVGAVALRVFSPENVGWAQNFLLVFSSLLIEAIPFVLIGALASAAIEVFVPARLFEK